MEEIGRLSKANARYEFMLDDLGLVVRGAHVEWVLEAAADIISKAAKADIEGRLMEIQTLVELGEAEEVDLDIAQYDAGSRFEEVPQCLVTLGTLDYRWTSPHKQPNPHGEGLRDCMERLVDQSKTRHGSFLSNVDGAFDVSPTD
ncbi:MAG: hypothetical protein ACFBRM_02060 [Pikeienuella sp.]